MADSDTQRNHLGQPVGFPMPGWTPRPMPPRTAMAGRFATVEPLDPDRHAAELFEANAEDREDATGPITITARSRRSPSTANGSRAPAPTRYGCFTLPSTKPAARRLVSPPVPTFS